MSPSGRRRLSDADRRARDRLILEDRSRGQSWPQIASRYRIAERTARRAAANAAKLAAERGLEDLDAGRILEDLVRGQLRAFYRVEELVHAESGAVAVGAARAIGRLGAEVRASLVAAGLLPPPDDAWLRRQIREAVEALARAAAAAEIPTATLDAELAREPVLQGRGVASGGGR